MQNPSKLQNKKSNKLKSFCDLETPFSHTQSPNITSDNDQMKFQGLSFQKNLYNDMMLSPKFRTKQDCSLGKLHVQQLKLPRLVLQRYGVKSQPDSPRFDQIKCKQCKKRIKEKICTNCYQNYKESMEKFANNLQEADSLIQKFQTQISQQQNVVVNSIPKTKKKQVASFDLTKKFDLERQIKSRIQKRKQIYQNLMKDIQYYEKIGVKLGEIASKPINDNVEASQMEAEKKRKRE